MMRSHTASPARLCGRHWPPRWPDSPACGRKGTITDLKPPPPEPPAPTGAGAAGERVSATGRARCTPTRWRWRRSPPRSARPATSIRPRPCAQRAAAFRDAFRGRARAVLLRGQGQQQSRRHPAVRQEGLGADTVSGGEIARALAAGVPPQRIVYAGIAKTDDEIRLALATGILQFNVESAQELRRIARARRRHGPDGAGGPAHQPGRRRRHAREDQHRPQARQVRHPLGRGAGRLRAGGQAAGRRAGRACICISARRSAGSSRSRPPTAGRRAVHESASRGHPAAPPRSRRRLRRALSRRAADRGRGACRAGAPRDRRARLRAVVRARAARWWRRRVSFCPR